MREAGSFHDYQKRAAWDRSRTKGRLVRSTMLRDPIFWITLTTLLFVLISPALGQTFRHKALSHATDCTSLTGKKANQFCYELDDDAWYVCEPSSGDCDTAGEWIKVASATTGGGWTDNGTEVVLTTQSDKVGIDVPSPELPLHLGGTGFRIGIGGDDLTSGAALKIGANGMQSLLNDVGDDLLLNFSGGDVGIGIAPETNLHISESSTDTTPTAEIEQLSTGDAALQFSIVGDAYAIGIDNSDGDTFKISYAAGAGTAVLGTNDRFMIDPSGLITINSKVARMDVAVDDDDCTGEQGRWWYDTTDGRFEFCNAGAGVPAILAGGGGAGAFADAGDPVVLHSVGKDVVIGPAQVNTSKLTIDGDADQVQLTIQGNATQTADLFVIENSGGNEILVIEQNGNATFSAEELLVLSLETPDDNVLVLRNDAATAVGRAQRISFQQSSTLFAAVPVSILEAEWSDNVDATRTGVLRIQVANNGAMSSPIVITGNDVTFADIMSITPQASAPATCGIGDFYVDTSGAACACTATNTWSNMTGTGSCA